MINNSFLIKQFLKSVRNDAKNAVFVVTILPDEKKVNVKVFFHNREVLNVKINSGSSFSGDFVIEEIMKKI